MYKWVLLSAGDPVESKCNLIPPHVSYQKHNLKSHNIKSKCSYKYYYKHITKKNLTTIIPCIVFDSMVSPYMCQSRKKYHSKRLDFMVAQYNKHATSNWNLPQGSTHSVNDTRTSSSQPQSDTNSMQCSTVSPCTIPVLKNLLSTLLHIFYSTGRSHFMPGIHSWKMSCKLKLYKSNTKFPFKTVYFWRLGHWPHPI